MAVDSGIKILNDNRQAGHNYFLFERFEAGVVLSGTEVKAARAGEVQLKDAYAEVVGGEAWLVNAHISAYSHGNRSNHEPVRRRKLLLHRGEIARLEKAVAQKGQAIIPLKLYFSHGYAKLLLGVGKGKKTHDKRHSIAERDAQRVMLHARRSGERGA